MMRNNDERRSDFKLWNTFEDVAAYFFFSKRKVYRLMNAGKLTACREGGSTRISSAAALEYEWSLRKSSLPDAE